SKRRPLLGSALDLAWVAMCFEWWVAKGRPRRAGISLAHVQHVVLMDVPILGGDVPPLIKLMVVSYTIPLQIVVTPRAIVDAVGAEVEAVVGAVGYIAHACFKRWLFSGIFAARHPEGDLGAIQDTHLHHPILVQLNGNIDACVCVVVVAVRE